MKHNIIIIGGGIIGTAVLDRLSFYNTDVMLLEANDDVASCATRANSGIAHAGYDCEPGTLKARFNVRGNKLIWQDVKDLNVPHLQCGSLVVAQESGLDGLKALESKAIANGVDVSILDREQTLRIEPNVADCIEYSLYAKSAGIVSPYQLAIAYADRAITNGGKITLNAKVESIKKVNGVYHISTTNGEYESDTIINCAGANGALINDLAGVEHYDTTYRRGDYFVLDQLERKNVSTVIFPLPTKAGKGILVAPTADGNVIYGPTSIEVKDGMDTSSSLEGLDEIRKNVPLSFKSPAFNKCIRVYSGVRSIIGHDFVIGRSSIDSDFIMAIGICSPGLTSAPAIAEHIEGLIVDKMGIERKQNIVKVMPKHNRLNELDDNTLDTLIAKDNRWAKVVCRCEKVTEAEIVDAIHSPLPATTVDAVKRRTRAGMGRCQGGFCGPRVMEIISRECNIPLNEVKKGGGEDSVIAKYAIKEVR